MERGTRLLLVQAEACEEVTVRPVHLREEAQDRGITGDGAGMGYAAAQLFAREGSQVAVVHIDEEAVRAAAESVRADGGDAENFRCDVGDPASVEARAYLGLLDALEGRPAPARKAVETSLEQAGRMGLFSLESRCRMYLA